MFDKSTNSLFETLGRSRQEVLGKKPVIPPPGTLARPGMKRYEDPVKAAPRVPASAIEKAALELLDVDGDPILVVDDELDVSAITPEEGIADEPDAKILGVRADTAVVFGIGLVLVVAIAYFAGRSTNKPMQAALVKPPIPVEAPKITPPQQAPIVAEKPAAPEPVAEQPAPPPAPVVKEGVFEMCVVGTSEEKAAKVVAALNNDMMSPIYGKSLTAFYDKSSSQVRIKGFESRDAAVLAAVQEMDDPTNGAHGSFKKAYFVRSKKKG